MKLKEIKGVEAFKTMGAVTAALREMFTDSKLQKIATEQKTGWILDFFTVSLEEKADLWMRLFLILNPGTTEDEVTMGAVLKFAAEFRNDPELMSLFFSQGGQIVENYSGSLTENTTEIEKT